jgi:HPt (histidine-containing phosphotransfer) domain-containing protein
MAAIDWDCLRHLTMDDPDLARETIELFLDQTPAQLALLSTHVLQSDTETVRRSAHQLKGGCLIVGAGRMAEICEQLETACEGGSHNDLRSLADALAREFMEVMKEVRNSLGEGNLATQAPQP